MNFGLVSWGHYIEREYGKLPHTVESITWSGGKHIFFKPVSGIKCKVGIRPGIDIRAEGGYIIAPPSIIDGKRYEWNVEHHLDETELADAPDWLIDLCRGVIPAAQTIPISKSKRNVSITSIAGKLRRAGLNTEEMYPMLMNINAKRCEPPLSDKEIRTIAISVGKYEPDESVGINDSWRKFRMPLNQYGKPIPNVDCALRVLEGMKYPVWFDTFHRRYFTNGNREWSDIDDLKLTAHMQRDLGLSRMSDEMVSKAIRIYAKEHTRNEPRDWFEKLVWDEELRVDRFFISAFGADETSYSMQASANFWVGMVARVYRPGCKLDNMVVLEGSQGLGKTRALGAIGGDWHTESEESVTSKDFFQCLDGKLIVEIAELDSFNRAEVTRIKQVISSRTDRYRPPYGRRAEDHPRQSIFVGTTNDDNYLKDHTGGRRFWPIKCTKIDLEFIKSNREQFFAEAVARFKQGDDWHRMPNDDTKLEQENRRQADEWESVVRDYLDSPAKQVTTIREVANECLGIKDDRLDMLIQKRLGRVLRAINWKKADRVLEDKKTNC